MFCISVLFFVLQQGKVEDGSGSTILTSFRFFVAELSAAFQFMLTIPYTVGIMLFSETFMHSSIHLFTEFIHFIY